MVTIEEFRKQLEQRGKPLVKEEIEKLNDSKELNDSGYKFVPRSSDTWKTVATVAFIILAISAAVFVYLAYNDKLNFVRINFPEINIPACPVAPTCPVFPKIDIPDCPACTNTCTPTLKCNSTS